MLFLAVLLGALAENFRENVIENKNEHEYLTSLVEDLIQDTTRLNSCIFKKLCSVDPEAHKYFKHA